MVEEISHKELENLWGKGTDHGVAYFLSDEDIEKWKNNGNFKHFKNELLNIPHIKFACTRRLNRNGCWYYFFSHSTKMSFRILNLFKALKSDDRVRLTDVSNISFGTDGTDIGAPKACNWF